MIPTTNLSLASTSAVTNFFTGLKDTAKQFVAAVIDTGKQPKTAISPRSIGTKEKRIYDFREKKLVPMSPFALNTLF
jgi:hypothetical protein